MNFKYIYMAKEAKPKKDINVNIDTKNVDIKITRKDGNTEVELDTPIVDVKYTNDEEGKDLEVKVSPLKALGQIVTRVIKKTRG
jgi:hypothetical protein